MEYNLSDTEHAHKHTGTDPSLHIIPVRPLLAHIGIRMCLQCVHGRVGIVAHTDGGQHISYICMYSMNEYSTHRAVSARPSYSVRSPDACTSQWRAANAAPGPANAPDECGTSTAPNLHISWTQCFQIIRYSESLISF